MKAIIVRSKEGKTVALQEDGTFVQVSNNRQKVGEVLNMKKTQPMWGWKQTLVSAAAMLLVVFGVGVKTYVTPAYVVSLDVNPGIVMEVNRFERVIGVEGQNEEGQAVVEQVGLKNKNVEEAVRLAVGQIKENGYFEENGVIYLATSSKDETKGEKMSLKLADAAEDEVEDQNIEAEVSSRLVGVEMVEMAKTLGVTPGKLNIIVNVLGQEPTQANLDASIKELMSMYKVRGNSNEAPGQNKPEKETGKPDKTIGKPEGTPGVGPEGNAPQEPVQNENQEMNQEMNQEQQQNQNPTPEPNQDQNQEQNQEQNQGAAPIL
jgi:hypothetical protein